MSAYRVARTDAKTKLKYADAGRTNRRATLAGEISERTRITSALVAEVVHILRCVRQDSLLTPVVAKVENPDVNLLKLRTFFLSTPVPDFLLNG